MRALLGPRPVVRETARAYLAARSAERELTALLSAAETGDGSKEGCMA